MALALAVSPILARAPILRGAAVASRSSLAFVRRARVAFPALILLASVGVGGAVAVWASLLGHRPIERPRPGRVKPRRLRRAPLRAGCMRTRATQVPDREVARGRRARRRVARPRPPGPLAASANRGRLRARAPPGPRGSARGGDLPPRRRRRGPGGGPPFVLSRRAAPPGPRRTRGRSGRRRWSSGNSPSGGVFVRDREHLVEDRDALVDLLACDRQRRADHDHVPVRHEIEAPVEGRLGDARDRSEGLAGGVERDERLPRLAVLDELDPPEASEPTHLSDRRVLVL